MWRGCEFDSKWGLSAVEVTERVLMPISSTSLRNRSILVFMKSPLSAAKKRVEVWGEAIFLI